MAPSVAERILMNNLKLPVFVIEGGDVSVYTSVKDAEIDIEPIDVKTGGLTAYDAEGRLLELETNHWRVSIALAENEPGHADELEAALREFLVAVNDPKAAEPECDLPCLVEACAALAKNTKNIKQLSTDIWGKLAGFFRR